ncbi:MAG: outer membrane beta-barrel protein [Gammaproteobacteria bacterium]|nr:outer membrane beta-barrel protein [Gammaproteobacteria bacterium]
MKQAIGHMGRTAGVLFAQAALAFACLAQEPAAPEENTGITVFPSAFYADGEPVSAMDVINRTPGFIFERGNNNMRGLESAAGNVLIDGRWPTIKANTLQEVLTSIPFAVIDRVEVIRADAADFDTMGRQVVVNVVRKEGGKSTLVTEAALKKYPDNDRDLGGTARAEYARSSGRFNFDASFVYKYEQFQWGTGEGPYTLAAEDPESSLNGRFDNDDWNKSVHATATGNYAWDRFDLGLNLTAKKSTLILDRLGNYATAAGEPYDQIVDIERGNDVFEVGSDISLNLAENRRLNAKMLHRLESSGSDSYLQLGALETLADDDFDWSETAARAIYRWDLSTPLSLEFGAEAAFNELDSFVEVSVGDSPLELPNDKISVAEDRYQAFAKAIVRVRPSFSFEAGLEFERSSLEQSGDANLNKEFDYLKPRLTATWSINGVTDVRLRVEKIVGQLDFYTFAASPSLETGISSAGNAGLEPEEATEYELQFERRFWGQGSAILTYTRYRLENALDYIPVGPDYDALGNAGRASRGKWILVTNFPLDPLGWTGATWRSRTVHFDSRITDPFTGETRRRTGRDSFVGFIGLTWELPQWNSVVGLDGFIGYQERSYRISEERLEREAPLPMNLWLDRTFGEDLSVRFEIMNVTPARRTRTRELYGAGRAGGEMSAVEVRETEQAMHFMLRIRKRF